MSKIFIIQQQVSDLMIFEMCKGPSNNYFELEIT